MRFLYFFGLIILFNFWSCNSSAESEISDKKPVETSRNSLKDHPSLSLSVENANRLAKLPLACMQIEFPNKLGQVLQSETDLGTPKELHPAFYGCFDWHSSVHGHWSLVNLLKQFPDLEAADEIKTKLLENISKENIEAEVAYFKKDRNYERTYGWAWLLKLMEEIHTWDDPMADDLEENLKPLADLLVDYYLEFLPKLTRPLRVGQHENTAFGLIFAYDYAVTFRHEALQQLIRERAKGFYKNDIDCPMAYEPDGFDFFSPCLLEVDVMQRVLDENEFHAWLNDFMPQLFNSDFDWEPGKVSDREDGKLVHLDGLNFSRAWVFYDLAKKYEDLQHLKAVGDAHFVYSFDDMIEGDSYMGSHWLGSFALYALNRR